MLIKACREVVILLLYQLLCDIKDRSSAPQNTVLLPPRAMKYRNKNTQSHIKMHSILNWEASEKAVIRIPPRPPPPTQRASMSAHFSRLQLQATVCYSFLPGMLNNASDSCIPDNTAHPDTYKAGVHTHTDTRTHTLTHMRAPQILKWTNS